MTAISKGQTVAEGSTILSLPYDWAKDTDKIIDEKNFFDMSKKYTSYLHELRDGKYRCVKTSAPESTRAGSDKVTFLLRTYASRNSLNKTLKQACIIQGATTGKDFANMRKAYMQAKSMSVDNFFEKIVHLGSILDPSITSLRKGPAVFSSSRSATSGENIKESLSKLRKHLETANIPMPAEEALEYYYAFEEIHPLQDGNGRIGMLLYNILLGSLSDLKLPEDKPGWA